MVWYQAVVATHTYLAGEIPWSRRWFSQGEAHPLHSGCADPCDFPKCGKLDCIICGSGGLRSRFPLVFLCLKVDSWGSYYLLKVKRWVFTFSSIGVMVVSYRLDTKSMFYDSVVMATQLQYSCLENPRDGGASWATVYVVAQSRTRLKRRSSSTPKLSCP